MRKTHERIIDALVNRKSLVVRGENMETGERGERYRVTTDRCLYYWGNKVAQIRCETTCTIDTCGYNTVTTRGVINTALRAFERLSDKQFSVFIEKGQLYVARDRNFDSPELWDGDSRILS